jgi:hypothetical protein
MRIVYWEIVIALTFATGSCASVLVYTAMKYRSKWLNILLSTCVIGIVIYNCPECAELDCLWHLAIHVG